MRTIFTIIICFILVSCNSQKSMVDKLVVKNLDIQKYLGTWHELARFDHKFERGLVGVTATYSMNTDGTIKVENKGYKDSLNGEKQIAIGKAKIPNPDIPAKLKVSFFWIFYADYFILELDKEYQWAIIGSKSDDYVWILHRKPKVQEEEYRYLVSLATARGYNTSKLINLNSL